MEEISMLEKYKDSFTIDDWMYETLKPFDYWKLDNEGNEYDIEVTRQYFKENATPFNIVKMIKDHKLWFDIPCPNSDPY